MKLSTKSEFAMPSPDCSRRGFMLRSLSFMAMTVGFSALTPLGARSDTGPSVADLEIATLGDWLRESEPDLAAQLEAQARKTSQLAVTQKIEWPIAQLARIVLTDDALVTGELVRAEVVFVDGWLLARSEAGAALLFSEARAQAEIRTRLEG